MAVPSLAADPDWLRGQCTKEIADLCRTAASNDVAAQLKLAEFYRDNKDLIALNGSRVDSVRLYDYWIENAAKNGNSEAQYLYGERNRISGNYELAVKWLYEAANHPTKPVANARYQLGIMFFNGQGVTKNLSESRSLMQLAAGTGHAQAREFLSVRKAQLEEAKVVFGEISKLESLSSLDLKNAANNLSGATGASGATGVQSLGQKSALPSIYMVSQSSAKFSDESNSTEFIALKRKAQSGDTESQKLLARRYAFGDGVTQNSVDAKFWFTKAADSGDSETQLGLALLYYDGLGTPRNYDQAAVWFNRVAKSGNAKALSYLASMYEKGWGVPQDQVKALNYYRAAADRGVDFAAYNVAQYYRDGKGGSVDRVLALRYFEMAAKAGIVAAKHDYAMALRWDPETQDSLTGRGKGKSSKESRKWLKQAAESGYAPAFFAYGFVLETEDKNNSSDNEALVWYQRAIAAKTDITSAYFQIALMYRDGRAVPKDIEKSVSILNSLIELNLGMDSDFKAKVAKELSQIATTLLNTAGRDSKEQKLALNIFNSLARNRSLINEDSLKPIALYAAITLRNEFAEGKRLSKNMEQYLIFAQLAVNFGDIASMSELANRYFIGLELPRNETKATDYFKLIVNTAPTQPNDKQLIANANYELGKIYRDAGDFDKAATYFDDASVMNPKAYVELVELAELEKETAIDLLFEKSKSGDRKIKSDYNKIAAKNSYARGKVDNENENKVKGKQFESLVGLSEWQSLDNYSIFVSVSSGFSTVAATPKSSSTATGSGSNSTSSSGASSFNLPIMVNFGFQGRDPELSYLKLAFSFLYLKPASRTVNLYSRKTVETPNCSSYSSYCYKTTSDVTVKQAYEATANIFAMDFGLGFTSQYFDLFGKAGVGFAAYGFSPNRKDSDQGLGNLIYYYGISSNVQFSKSWSLVFDYLIFTSLGDAETTVSSTSYPSIFTDSEYNNSLLLLGIKYRF